MSEAVRPGPDPAHPPADVLVRSHLLVVDPNVQEDSLRLNLARRGVSVTVTGSTLDALVEFGRTCPTAVIVAPTACGLPPEEFVRTIRRLGNPFVIAVLDRPHGSDVGALLLAGGSAVIETPYDAAAVWALLLGSGHAFDRHASVSIGPIELDARAYTVKVHGERIHDLPLKEFELLHTLMQAAPDVISNDELRVAVWGPDGDRIQDNNLAVHMARLRHRLEGVARIRRLRGRGYTLILD